MTPQKFRIISDQQVQALRTILSNLPKDGTVEVVVRPYKKDCTAEQRSLMWVRLAEIAEQAWVAGKQYDSDTWHEYFKKQYLPEAFVDGMTKDKYRKWTELPNGERVLVGSTEGLTTKGKAEYMTQIEAFAAVELGVQFSADPRKYGA